MRNYSIRYLDAGGHTQNSEFLPFEDNRSAVDFARIGLIRSAIVEVWKDDDLVERLYPGALAARVATAGVADHAVRAFARADSRNGLDGWDNEGGSSFVREGANR
jgi:hypothetical protein